MRQRSACVAPTTRLRAPPVCNTQASLGALLLFGRLDKAAQSKIADHMWERSVAAGEILIQEGEVGLAASELYVVKAGKFEVRRVERQRDGAHTRARVIACAHAAACMGLHGARMCAHATTCAHAAAATAWPCMACAWRAHGALVLSHGSVVAGSGDAAACGPMQEAKCPHAAPAARAAGS